MMNLYVWMKTSIPQTMCRLKLQHRPSLNSSPLTHRFPSTCVTNKLFPTTTIQTFFFLVCSLGFGVILVITHMREVFLRSKRIPTNTNIVRAISFSWGEGTPCALLEGCVRADCAGFIVRKRQNSTSVTLRENKHCSSPTPFTLFQLFSNRSGLFIFYILLLLLLVWHVFFSAVSTHLQTHFLISVYCFLIPLSAALCFHLSSSDPGVSSYRLCLTTKPLGVC